MMIMIILCLFSTFYHIFYSKFIFYSFINGWGGKKKFFLSDFHSFFFSSFLFSSTFSASLSSGTLLAPFFHSAYPILISTFLLPFSLSSTFLFSLTLRILLINQSIVNINYEWLCTVLASWTIMKKMLSSFFITIITT